MSLLIVIELRNKDQRLAWDVSNIIVCMLTYLGQPLGQPVKLPGQVKLKVPFPGTTVLVITSSLFEKTR